MIPASPSFSRRHALIICTVFALAGLVAVGCSEQADPTGPSEVPPGVAFSGSELDFGVGPGSITVEVRDGGTRFENVLATGVHNQNGPFAVAGEENTLIKGPTDANGLVTFTGLPLGAYCVHIASISLDDATIPGLVVPVVGAELGSGSDIGPALIRRQGGTVRTIPFTAQNYLDHCVNTTSSTAPIFLTEAGPAASVRISPLQAARLQAKFLDLDGNPTSVAGWALLGLPGTIPWFDLETLGLREGTNPGVLQAVSKMESNGFTGFQGLPPGVDLALEVLSGSQGGGQGVSTMSSHSDQGLLIASLAKVKLGGAGSTTTLEELSMEPLLCTMDDTKFANPGTATGKSIEIVGTVTDGFRADDSFAATRSIALWYEVKPSGDDELRMRFHSALSEPMRTLRAPYSCSGGKCVQGPVSGSSGATARLFQREGENGRIQLTWLIEGVPFDENLAAAEHRLDDFPETSKDTELRSYSPIDPIPPLGSVCDVEAGNDPPFWIGT